MDKDFVFFTDLHQESRYKFGGEKFWHDLGINTIKLAFELADDVGAPVIFIGDIFEMKDRHPAWLINSTRRAIKEGSEEMGVPSYWLVGNHDIGDRGETIMDVFSDIENATVISEPEVIRINGLYCGFIPYLDSAQETSEWAEKWADELGDKKKLLFMHHGLEGAITGLGYTFPEGVSNKAVSEYDYVFCGHYHKHQRVFDNAWYIGSPYQLDFGEREDGEKGVWHFDYEEGTLTQYRVPGAPTFVQYEIEELEGFNLEELSDSFDGEIVKIIFHVTRGQRENLDIREVKQQVRDLGAVAVTVNTELKDLEKTRMEVEGDFTWKKTIESWAESKNLSEGSKEVGLEIFGEVKNEAI